MSISRYRADRQVMFLRERAGKDIGATGTDNGSRRHVPPIMLLPIDPAPTRRSTLHKPEYPISIHNAFG